MCPPEIWHAIFLQLKPRDRKVCRLVCHYWKDICNNTYKYILIHNYVISPPIAKRLSEDFSYLQVLKVGYIGRKALRYLAPTLQHFYVLNGSHIGLQWFSALPRTLIHLSVRYWIAKTNKQIFDMPRTLITLTLLRCDITKITWGFEYLPSTLKYLHISWCEFNSDASLQYIPANVRHINFMPRRDEKHPNFSFPHTLRSLTLFYKYRSEYKYNEHSLNNVEVLSCWNQVCWKSLNNLKSLYIYELSIVKPFPSTLVILYIHILLYPSSFLLRLIIASLPSSLLYLRINIYNYKQDDNPIELNDITKIAPNLLYVYIAGDEMFPHGREAFNKFLETCTLFDAPLTYQNVRDHIRLSAVPYLYNYNPIS